MFEYELPSGGRVFSETPLQSLPDRLKLFNLVPIIWRIWVYFIFVIFIIIYRFLQFYPIHLQPFGIVTIGWPRRDETNERPLGRNDVLEHMADGSPEFYEGLRRRRRQELHHNPFHLF